MVTLLSDPSVSVPKNVKGLGVETKVFLHLKPSFKSFAKGNILPLQNYKHMFSEQNLGSGCHGTEFPTLNQSGKNVSWIQFHFSQNLIKLFLKPSTRCSCFLNAWAKFQTPVGQCFNIVK